MDASSVRAGRWAGVDERASWQECGCRDQLSGSGGLLLYQFTICVPVGATSDTLACDCFVHQYGAIAAGRRAPHYPSDMTDAEWVQARASMPVPAWLEGRGGRPEAYCHRETVDAVR